MSRHSHHSKAEATSVEYVKFVGVLGGVALISYVLHQAFGDSTSDFLRLFMGSFMLVFASFKLVGYRMFVEMFPMYDPIAKRSKLYAKVYPFIELALGVLAIANLFETARLISVVVLMGVGAAGIVHSVYVQKRKIHCACLGNIIKLPLSTVSLAEDIGMAGLAIYMLFI